MVYCTLPSMNSILFSFFLCRVNFPSNNTKCSGAFFSLRSEIVLITFSYWPAFQPAPSIRSSTPTFLRYSPYRTGRSWHPFLSRPQGPQCSSGTVWKSTYPCPASYCLKLSMVFIRLLDVSVLAWNYRKHIAQTIPPVCVCYITLPYSISRVPRAHISAVSRNPPDFCSICPILQPFQHRFLYYLLHFHSPSQLSAPLRHLRCFQARRGSKLWSPDNPQIYVNQKANTTICSVLCAFSHLWRAEKYRPLRTA